MPTAAHIDWEVWVPVVRTPPLCTLRELQDGTYTIADLADMNDAIALLDEAQARMRDEQERLANRG